MSSRSVTVILNESAGTKKEDSLCELIGKRLGHHGIEADLRVVARGDSITKVAESAVRGGASIVVAGGGDGTVSSVASVVVKSEVLLGILPLGTLNHFAKDLGLPLDIENALEVVGTGVARRVDAGEVNGKIFVNNSSIGLYPAIVRERTAEQRLGHSKWAALLWSTLATLHRYPMFSVALASEKNGKAVRRTPLVFIGNNQYETKGFAIGSRPRLDGGTLGVYVPCKDGATSLLRMGIEALFGTARKGVDFDYWAVENLRVDVGSRTVQIANDGEVSTFSPPLFYQSHPLALKVLVPRLK